MINIQKAQINTAGAYVYTNGFFLFAIGIQSHNGHIPVFRLGGHREENETGWQCAVREVYEEANLKIKPLTTQTTYLSDGNHIEKELQEIQWQTSIEQECNPLLVVAYYQKGGTLLSLMYLAQADGYPTPSSEIKGLLLLEKENVHSLCREPYTLGQYLSGGGRAILNDEFDMNLVLEPFAQLRLLSRILKAQFEIKTAA